MKIPNESPNYIVMTAPLELVAVVDNELCKHSSSEFETQSKPNIKVASLANGNPPIN
jgi:hypothetical protein